MPIKGRTRAFLEKVGRAGTRTRQALAWGRSLPSPAWTLVTPDSKRTPPGRGTNKKAAGVPPLSRPTPARHVALCYTPHCTPGSSPYAYKRNDQGPLREGWPRGDEDETGALLGPLASLTRVDACNPLLQAHPTWARDEHEGRGIPTSLTPVSGRLTPFPPLYTWILSLRL